MRVFSFDTHGSALGYSTTLPSLSTSKTTKQNTVRTSLPLEREGSRILSLRHGLEPHEVALCRACLMPTGEVETPFNTTELTTNTGDDIWERREHSSSGAAAACGTIVGTRNVSHKGDAKALMSMSDAWKSVFTDRSARVHSKIWRVMPKIGGRVQRAHFWKSVMQGQSAHGCVCLRHTQTGKKQQSKTRNGQSCLQLIKRQSRSDGLRHDTTNVARKSATKVFEKRK